MAKTRSRGSKSQKGPQVTAKSPAQATQQGQAIVAEKTMPVIESVTMANGEAESRELVTTEPEERRALTTPIPYPSWPTSKPGPRATPPPPGMRPLNALRPEQVVEVGYNQETGEPGSDSLLRSLPDENIVGRGQTSFDQPRTAQEEFGRRKKRL